MVARVEATFDHEFDVVVVGGGSAGCVVASRLSEDSRNSVCLLEAGERDRNPWIHIPMGFGKLINNANLTWGYATEPEQNLGNRRIVWTRGKVLGGSGSLNGLVFLRGAATDFDEWQRLGARGWSYLDVLPYFKRLESTSVGSDEYHGRAGPITVTRNARQSSSAQAFVAACEHLQYQNNEDFNGKEIDGVGFAPINVNGRWRHSTASAYLKPSLKRSNLHLLTKAHVDQIVFRNKRAVGVELTRHGRRMRIGARKEIVLSGGAINTPIVLLRSGIGPGHDLASVAIDVRHDLPGVGKNLQDHLQVGFAFQTNASDSINEALQSRRQSARLLLDWLFTKSGPMAGGAVEATLFAKSKADLATPDLQFQIMNFSRNPSSARPHREPGCTLLYNVCRPKSRGHVGLANTRTFDPVIAPNYLEHPDDMVRMIAGFYIAQRIASTEPFRSLIVDTIRPGSNVCSHDQIEAFVRDCASTVYHPCGTCRMGEDQLAVVDSELRVRGLEGIRVIDASVMPAIPSSNIHPATIMIAEKGADLMRRIT